MPVDWANVIAAKAAAAEDLVRGNVLEANLEPEFSRDDGEKESEIVPISFSLGRQPRWLRKYPYFGMPKRTVQRVYEC